MEWTRSLIKRLAPSWVCSIPDPSQRLNLHPFCDMISDLSVFAPYSLHMVPHAVIISAGKLERRPELVGGPTSSLPTCLSPFESRAVVACWPDLSFFLAPSSSSSPSDSEAVSIRGSGDRRPSEKLTAASLSPSDGTASLPPAETLLAACAEEYLRWSS
ncbi:hypothetical protein ACCO45_010759 [Purpureocillium lilacinum]|uniref:Uncharacterized protein n=1 Tax=Purpureocillium lilacinum TaxID=33203 RepID=A0ACC4DID6_PURLI